MFRRRRSPRLARRMTWLVIGVVLGHGATIACLPLSHATRNLRQNGLACLVCQAAKRAPWPSSCPYPVDARVFFARFQAARAGAEGRIAPTPNAFTLVVAVASARRRRHAGGSNKATAKLFEIADTPEKMLALGERGVIEHIKTIGLFRNKAKNVIKLSRLLVEGVWRAQVPSSRAALQSLPGVGRKTANVVLNMWWRFPAQAVDTHIFRLRATCAGHRAGQGRWTPSERAIEDKRAAQPAEYQAFTPHHW